MLGMAPGLTFDLGWHRNWYQLIPTTTHRQVSLDEFSIGDFEIQTILTSQS
jgi:hypothetical protein